MFTYLGYAKFIEKQLKEKNHHLPKVFQKYNGLLIPSEQDVQQFYQTLVDNYSQEVIAYFNNIKGYDFSIQTEATKNNPVPDYLTPIKVSFESMVKESVGSVVSANIDKKIGKKEDVMCVAYEAMREYLITHELPEDKLSHYMKAVISAYIAFTMGFVLNAELSPKVLENRIPTTSQLFNAARNCTNKYK